jgi:hypothetical protein
VTGLLRTLTACGGLAAALLVLTGCGRSDGGLSDNDRRMLAIKSGADALRSQGAKLQEKQYPLGMGWVVDLRGMTITDDLLKQVKQLGNIAEIDLANTGVTDDHLKLIHEIGLHVLLARLDLSHTAVTDAAFEHLDGCIFLIELNLTGTKATPAAAERFKANRQSDPRTRIKTTTVKL